MEEMPQKFYQIPEHRKIVLEYTDWLIETKYLRNNPILEIAVAMSLLQWIYTYKNDEGVLNVIRGILFNTKQMWNISKKSFDHAWEILLTDHGYDYDFWQYTRSQIFPLIRKDITEE